MKEKYDCPPNIVAVLTECYLKSNKMNELTFPYYFTFQNNPYLTHFILTMAKRKFLAPYIFP